MAGQMEGEEDCLPILALHIQPCAIATDDDALSWAVRRGGSRHSGQYRWVQVDILPNLGI